jgi:glycosyltransferase involved in cell wall biosynthesis
MKIAIMMRVMDQDSGLGFFTERLLEYMLNMDHENSYLLLYRSKKWFGHFSKYKNVKEILIPGFHKLFHDQVSVPYTAWKEDADIIFNPKFSVPLISHCPVTMGLQEPAWWAWPQHYLKWDVFYMKLLLPLYCRKAAHLFPWSNFNLDETRKYLKLPLKNITITYPAPKECFKVINDNEELNQIKAKYNLPEKFIFGITRVDHIGMDNVTFYSGKNVETTLKAFSLIRDKVPHKLVIAGRNVREYLLRTGWTEEDLRNIVFVGFIPHEDLAKLLNIASLFVIPSYYEGFGFTLVEAMASGCACVASTQGACPEISNSAALLADPFNPSDFAEKMLAVLNNDTLRNELCEKGIHRASTFNWKTTARLTLEGLTQVVNERQRRKFPALSVNKA